MSMAMVIAYALIGLLSTGLARRGIGTIYLLGGGISLALLSLLLIITQASEHHYLLWIAYGVFSSVGTLAYSLTAVGFPVALSGRANSTLNLMVFLGAFGLQWGMGGVIDLLQASGHSAQIAHRDAFALLFAVQLTTFAWLFVSGRKTVR
jgi:hypothetical protein